MPGEWNSACRPAGRLFQRVPHQLRPQRFIGPGLHRVFPGVLAHGAGDPLGTVQVGKQQVQGVSQGGQVVDKVGGDDLAQEGVLGILLPLHVHIGPLVRRVELRRLLVLPDPGQEEAPAFLPEDDVPPLSRRLPPGEPELLAAAQEEVCQELLDLGAVPLCHRQGLHAPPVIYPGGGAGMLIEVEERVGPVVGPLHGEATQELLVQIVLHPPMIHVDGIAPDAARHGLDVVGPADLGEDRLQMPPDGEKVPVEYVREQPALPEGDSLGNVLVLPVDLRLFQEGVALGTEVVEVKADVPPAAFHQHQGPAGLVVHGRLIHREGARPGPLQPLHPARGKEGQKLLQFLRRDCLSVQLHRGTPQGREVLVLTADGIVPLGVDRLRQDLQRLHGEALGVELVLQKLLCQGLGGLGVLDVIEFLHQDRKSVV